MNDKKVKPVTPEPELKEIKGIFPESDRKQAQETADTMLCIIVKKLLDLNLDEDTAKRITKINHEKTGYDSWFLDYKKPTQRWLMNRYMHKIEPGAIELVIEYPQEISLDIKE